MLGRTVLPNNTISPTRVSADGAPSYKPGGITIDWSSVAAPGSDVTLLDGSIIKSGQKYLRYGQVLTKNTAGTQQTLTSTATGGAFTLTMVRPDNQQSVTTASIAWNATAATILAAIQAVLGPNQATAVSGGPLNTTPVVVTYGFFVPLMTVTNNTLTGGALTPSITVAGTLAGYFGPYDPAAGDGRQTLTRGDVYVADETILQYPGGSSLVSAANDQYGSAIEAGLVYIDRIIQSGAGAASLAAGPTLANLNTAFPNFRYAKDS